MIDYLKLSDLLAATFEFDPAVVGIMVTLFLAGFAGFTKWLSDRTKPLQPNSGKSVGDLPEKVARLTEDHAELKGVVAEMRGELHGVSEVVHATASNQTTIMTWLKPPNRSH